MTSILWRRLEAFAFSLLIGAYLFQTGAFQQFSLGALAFLLLWPDIFCAFYLFGNKIGAFFYNIVHSFALPLVMALLWLRYGATHQQLEVLLFWMLHISVDRALGFGLKEMTGFKFTDLTNRT